MIAESGACGLDGGWEFGVVEGFLGCGNVLFGDDIVNRLFHSNCLLIMKL